MTVETTQNRSAIVASGQSREIDFSFPYLDAADIKVFKKTTNGVRTQLGINEYSVTNPGGGVGGRVTLSQFPAVGDVLSTVRIPSLKQETVLDENTKFYLKSIERAFDRQTMFSQRLADLISRSLVLDDADLAGAGAYQAGGNRITGLGNAVSPTDAVTLAQAQALLGNGSGVGGGGTTPTWPTDPVPQIVVDQVISNAALLSLFSPINVQVGNLAQQVLALNSSSAGFATSIGTISTQMTDLQAEVDLLSQLQGDGTEIITLITTEQTQRIDGDAAISSLIAKIGAASSDGVSFIMNTATAKISSTETLGQRFSGIATSLSTNSASIAAEATARTSADTAISQTIAKIGALTDSGASFLFDLNTAKVGPSETFAQRLNGIASALAANSAAITTEQSVRATADTSMAASITTMQSQVSGYNVAIQTNATAINGLSAKYTVKIDNNGKVTGYGLISDANNGTPTSAFVVLADAFKVFNGASDVAPFEVVGGVVRMQNVQIAGALVVDGSLTTSKFSVLSGNGQSVDLQNGRITWSNGTYMKAVGVGFGSSGQFIEWYGPHFSSLASCTEANAISYLKTNGSAYFGGSLSAGILRNAVTGTNTANNASATLGPFGTNGGSKTVVLSYTFQNTASAIGSDPGSGPISAVVVLERSLDGGSSWTQIGTLNVAGTAVYVPGSPDAYAAIMSGSTTVTDTNGSTGNFMYRGRITSRLVSVATGVLDQRITIVSTEE